MRILNWVQNKLGKVQEKKRFDADALPADAPKEEFSDWPQALLAIGTLGNNELKEDLHTSENPHSSAETPEFTLEQVIKLQKELNKLLTNKPKCSTDRSEDKGGEAASLPLDRFLNRPSSLDIDRTLNLNVYGEDEEDGNLSPNTKIILNKARDILADKRNAIKKRSISFLIKKMFVCSSGFGPSPSLRDPLPESRMEKLLRTILTKKIYPHNLAPSSTRYLEKRPSEKEEIRDEMEEKGEDRCKWVKTDSEYIVLEM